MKKLFPIIFLSVSFLFLFSGIASAAPSCDESGSTSRTAPNPPYLGTGSYYSAFQIGFKNGIVPCGKSNSLTSIPTSSTNRYISTIACMSDSSGLCPNTSNAAIGLWPATSVSDAISQINNYYSSGSWRWAKSDCLPTPTPCNNITWRTDTVSGNSQTDAINILRDRIFNDPVSCPAGTNWYIRKVNRTASGNTTQNCFTINLRDFNANANNIVWADTKTDYCPDDESLVIATPSFIGGASCTVLPLALNLNTTSEDIPAENIPPEDRPSTQNGEITCPCQLNHFFVLALNLYNFALWYIALPLSGLLILIAGLLMALSGFNANWYSTGKSMIWGTAIALVLIFGSWLIIDIVLKAIGYPLQWSVF